MNNSPAHLVARALRDRRTVTWQYHLHAPNVSCRFYGFTRSQILKDVRRTPEDQFRFGVEYDASRPPSTNGRYGLQAYAIIPEPPAAPPTDAAAARVDLRRLIILAQLDNAETTDELDALVTAVRLRAATVLQTFTLSANQTG